MFKYILLHTVYPLPKIMLGYFDMQAIKVDLNNNNLSQIWFLFSLYGIDTYYTIYLYGHKHVSGYSRIQ